MDVTAVAFNWVLWAILAFNFGLAIYGRRPRFWKSSVRQHRWLSVSLLVLQCAQLVNLYDYELHLHIRWAPFLFISAAPLLAMTVVTSVLELRASSRIRGSI